MAGQATSIPSSAKAGLLVEHSRDPECDAARALVAKGITGELTLLDGKTGIPRTIINIEKAAKLRTAEPDRGVVHFQKWAPFSLVNAPSPETGSRIKRSPEVVTGRHDDNH